MTYFFERLAKAINWKNSQIECKKNKTKGNQLNLKVKNKNRKWKERKYKLISNTYNFCNIFEINLTLKWCKKDSLINGKNLITVPYQGTYSFFYFPIKIVILKTNCCCFMMRTGRVGQTKVRFVQSSHDFSKLRELMIVAAVLCSTVIFSPAQLKMSKTFYIQLKCWYKEVGLMFGELLLVNFI